MPQFFSIKDIESQRRSVFKCIIFNQVSQLDLGSSQLNTPCEAGSSLTTVLDVKHCHKGKARLFVVLKHAQGLNLGANPSFPLPEKHSGWLKVGTWVL